MSCLRFSVVFLTPFQTFWVASTILILEYVSWSLARIFSEMSSQVLGVFFSVPAAECYHRICHECFLIHTLQLFSRPILLQR